MSGVNLKEKLEEKYTIVCDTNVFLRIYDYSPEFTDFALRCLSEVKPFIQIGHTTLIEYKRNHMAKYAEAKNKIANMNSKIIEIISLFQTEAHKELNRIDSYHFPDIQELRTSAQQKLTELKCLFEEYYNEHELLSEINDEYLQNDPIKNFMSSISTQVFPEIDTETIYRICDEGRKRYKDKIPPGFMDKEKDGIRKYSDLILWKEILVYALANKKNVLFVTDDVKSDWWEEEKQQDGTFHKSFHKKLAVEFEKNTEQKLIAVTSHDLYKMIANEYLVDVSDAIDIALQQTNQSFIDSVQQEVFESIQDKLAYSQEEYVDESNQIGSEGLSEFEIESFNLMSAEQVERNDDEIIYSFTYEISLSATSCEYWGRDDDTKEVITSPDNQHEFEGLITVQITRHVDQFLDFNFDDKFDDAEIIDCKLVETKFISCYKEDEWDTTGAENYCPQCGNPLTLENDSLNGFCCHCTEKYDK